MSIEGVYTYQKSRNFENFLKTMGVKWLNRKTCLLVGQTVTVERPRPGIVSITTRGIKTNTRDIVLGEEHPEITPYGESVKGVTVQEGDNCLITRTRAPSGSMEIRREFTKEKMIMILRHNELDIEAERIFRRRS